MPHHGVRHIHRLSAMILAALLGGCFAADVPAITEQTAEGVGARLEYRVYSSDPEAGGSNEVITLVRRDGVEYQLQLSDEDIGTDPFANGLFLRRLGSRGAAPVYLVQFDIQLFELDPDITPDEVGFKFMFYPVAIGRDGTGIAGTIRCDDETVLAKARTHGVEIGCVRLFADPTSRILNRPTEPELWRFLVDLLESDAFEWEDDRRRSFLEEAFGP
jgi:hypothetical protein